MADENDTNEGSSSSLDNGKLMAFIERKERVAAEKKDAADAEKELNAEIKDAGFDLKYVNHCVRERAKDEDARDEERMLRDTYESAAGLA